MGNTCKLAHLLLCLLAILRIGALYAQDRIIADFGAGEYYDSPLPVDHGRNISFEDWKRVWEAKHDRIKDSVREFKNKHTLYEAVCSERGPRVSPSLVFTNLAYFPQALSCKEGGCPRCDHTRFEFNSDETETLRSAFNYLQSPDPLGFDLQWQGLLSLINERKAYDEIFSEKTLRKINPNTADRIRQNDYLDTGLKIQRPGTKLEQLFPLQTSGAIRSKCLATTPEGFVWKDAYGEFPSDNQIIGRLNNAVSPPMTELFNKVEGLKTTGLYPSYVGYIDAIWNIPYGKHSNSPPDRMLKELSYRLKEFMDAAKRLESYNPDGALILPNCCTHPQSVVEIAYKTYLARLKALISSMQSAQKDISEAHMRMVRIVPIMYGAYYENIQDASKYVQRTSEQLRRLGDLPLTLVEDVINIFSTDDPATSVDTRKASRSLLSNEREWRRAIQGGRKKFASYLIGTFVSETLKQPNISKKLFGESSVIDAIGKEAKETIIESIVQNSVAQMSDEELSQFIEKNYETLEKLEHMSVDQLRHQDIMGGFDFGILGMSLLGVDPVDIAINTGFDVGIDLFKVRGKRASLLGGIMRNFTAYIVWVESISSVISNWSSILALRYTIEAYDRFWKINQEQYAQILAAFELHANIIGATQMVNTWLSRHITQHPLTLCLPPPPEGGSVDALYSHLLRNLYDYGLTSMNTSLPSINDYGRHDHHLTISLTSSTFGRNQLNVKIGDCFCEELNIHTFQSITSDTYDPRIPPRGANARKMCTEALDHYRKADLVFERDPNTDLISKMSAKPRGFFDRQTDMMGVPIPHFCQHMFDPDIRELDCAYLCSDPKRLTHFHETSITVEVVERLKVIRRDEYTETGEYKPSRVDSTPSELEQCVMACRRCGLPASWIRGTPRL